MHKVIQTIKSNLLLKNYIKYFRNLRVVGTLASAGLITVMTLTVHPIINKTQSAEAAIGASVQSETSITMAIDKADASVDLMVQDSNGTFAASSDINQASFNVSTNNYTGYTLSIAGSDDSGLLSNNDINNATATLESISTYTDANTFNGSTSYNGKWGYFPSIYDSSENQYFRPAPTTSASTLNTTSCANGEPTTTCPNNQAEDNYTIALGARVDYSIPAGTYTNTFTITAVANPISYSITYADDTGDSTVANLPARQYDDNGITNTTITLSSTIPTRTNYTFLYWCLGSTSNNGTSCSGITYNAGINFGIDQTMNNTTTLYAVWSPNITIKTNTGISKVTLNKKATTDSGSDNLAECTTTAGCTVTGLVYGKTYAIAATTETGYTFTSWNAGNNGSIADTSSTGASTTYTVGAGESTITPTATINSYTISLSRSNADAIVIDGTSRTGSSISLTYGSHTISGTYPSGYEFSSWATSNSTNLAIANTSSASTSITVHGAATLTLNGKQSCVQISGTMQAFTGTGNYCSTSGTLTDNRDNNQYLVAKLADGKWWMLDNLRLGSTSTISLTTSNTNIASNWTLPASSSSGFNKYNTAKINTESKDQTTTSYGSGSGKIGVYYNYCAASAGTYCMAEGSGSGNASYDICPKGWRMPTGGYSGEYQALYTAYSSDATNFRTALSTSLSGNFHNSSANYQGSSGFFWSSNYYAGSIMYALGVGSSNVNPTRNDYRDYGYSVRCILK